MPWDAQICFCKPALVPVESMQMLARLHSEGQVPLFLLPKLLSCLCVTSCIAVVLQVHTGTCDLCAGRRGWDQGTADQQQRRQGARVPKGACPPCLLALGSLCHPMGGPQPPKEPADPGWLPSLQIEESLLALCGCHKCSS